jgi:hypothetical protein
MEEEVKYDNFYTPGNNEFYDSFNYADLPKDEHHIRLIRIYPLCRGQYHDSVRSTGRLIT